MTARGTRSECRLLAAPLAASTEEVSAWPQWTSTCSRLLSCAGGVTGVLVVVPVCCLPGERAPGARHVHVRLFIPYISPAQCYCPQTLSLVHAAN